MSAGGRTLPLALAGALALGAAAAPADRRLQALVALALLAALWQIGAALVAWMVPDLEPLSRAVARFALAVAAGSLAATVLGHLGWLRPLTFLLLVAAAAAASAWVRPRGQVVAPPAGQPEAPPVEAGFARLDRALLWAALAGTAIAYLSEANLRLLAAPGKGPDDLSYHLSAIAVWSHYGDLRMLKFPMGDWSTSFYPILPELTAWQLLAPFRDSDLLARWAELPFAIASFVAVAALARRLGVSSRSAGFAAVLYATLRRVAVLAFAAGSDEVIACLFLVALDAALACAVLPRRGRYAYLGVALGLLAASKYLALYFLPAIVLVAVVACWLWAPRGMPRRPVTGALLLLGCALLVGGYSYLRNLVATGNPFYPQQIAVAGVELLPGRPEFALSSRRAAGEVGIDIWDFLAGPDSRFGSVFGWTLLPAALLASLWAAFRRRALPALVFALPALMFVEFLYLTADHRDIRYLFAACAIAAIAFAWLVDELGIVGVVLRDITLGVVLIRTMRWLPHSGAKTFALAVALVVLAWWAPAAWRHSGGARQVRAAVRGRGAAIAGLAVALALFLGARAGAYEGGRLRDDAAAQALERLAGARGVRVGYVGYNAPYLFFGSRLQNDVRMVPRSFNLAAEYYQWGGVPDRPLPEGRYRRWRGVLDDIGVQYVVVVRGDDEDPERRWMANHPEAFRRVYWTDPVEIWQRAPAGDAASGKPR